METRGISYSPIKLTFLNEKIPNRVSSVGKVVTSVGPDIQHLNVCSRRGVGVKRGEKQFFRDLRRKYLFYRKNL